MKITILVYNDELILKKRISIKVELKSIDLCLISINEQLEKVFSTDTCDPEIESSRVLSHSIVDKDSYCASKLQWFCSE